MRCYKKGWNVTIDSWVLLAVELGGFIGGNSIPGLYCLIATVQTLAPNDVIGTRWQCSYFVQWEEVETSITTAMCSKLMHLHHSSKWKYYCVHFPHFCFYPSIIIYLLSIYLVFKIKGWNCLRFDVSSSHKQSQGSQVEVRIRKLLDN